MGEHEEDLKQVDKKLWSSFLCAAFITLFSETSTGCDMSPKGLLSARQFPIPVSKNWGTWKVAQVYFLGVSSSRAPPA